MTAPSDRRRPASLPAPREFDLLQFYRDEGVVALFGRGASSDLVYEGSGFGTVASTCTWTERAARSTVNTECDS